MKSITLLVSLALSSLALAAPARAARGQNGNNIAGAVKTANVAVLRFDNAVQTINDQQTVQPALRQGTQAVSIIQQASQNVEGRAGVQGSPQVQQSITDFSIAMNKAADDLVTKRDIIRAAGSDGIFLDVYTAQAQAGIQLIQGVMDTMPPRERNNAAQALAAIPNGLDKVQAAFTPGLGQATGQASASGSDGAPAPEPAQEQIQ
jgi:hypothetical protein